MNDEDEPEMFTCNVCGFLRFASAFSYKNPTSDIDGGDNYCIECEEKAIKCPKCKALGFWIPEEKMFAWNQFTVTGAGYDVVGVQCRCGFLIGLTGKEAELFDE